VKRRRPGKAEHQRVALASADAQVSFVSFASNGTRSACAVFFSRISTFCPACFSAVSTLPRELHAALELL
jgi:hypothetical protein